MSTRSGNNTKKSQAYQNTFAFKHNKNSQLTKKIAKVPLDNLCKRCLDKLEWRIDYRKYKPLTTAGRCNMCQEKTIYKAYRTICDNCSIKNKLCAKCANPVEGFVKPTSWRNDPNFRSKKNDPIMEIIAGLKKRHKRTCVRKISEGLKLEFDEEKGIVNAETKELIIDVKHIYYNALDSSEDNSGDDDEEEEDDINEEIADKIKAESLVGNIEDKDEMEDQDDSDNENFEEMKKEIKSIEKNKENLNKSIEEEIKTTK